MRQQKNVYNSSFLQKFKLLNMSFFQKDQTSQNLQYDDIAFLHFLLTISITSSLMFGYLVYRQYQQSRIENIKNYKKLKASGLFKKQIQNEKKVLKQKVITRGFWIMLLVFVGSIVLSIMLGVYVGTHTTQMIGFDPHQILGIDSSATTSQIKKAYRKLALQYHPDRNQGDPAANGKFIMISKAYECLTDEEKRENCLKFGNPDGKKSFQVGIGLPKFMISKDNQYVILPIVFVILLIIIPSIILHWGNSLKHTDNCGVQVENYQVLYPFFTQTFNASYGFYLVTAMRELQNNNQLSKDDYQEFIKFINKQKMVDIQYVTERMTQGQIYVLHQLFKQLALRQPDMDMCRRLPQILNALMKFSLLFARRINDQKFLLQEKLPIQWIGTKHVFMLLQFIRTFYNCSLFNPPKTTPFDHLQLSQQDSQISYKNALVSLRQVLSSQQKQKSHISLFTQANQPFIKAQLKDLPVLNLEVNLTIQKKPVKQMSVNDFGEIAYKVEKLNQTTGYCYLKRFPYLKEEKYYFMLIYGDNLIHFEQITFEQGKNVNIGSFPYRQGFTKQMKFYAFIFSDCRYGLDIQKQLDFNVIEPKQQDLNRQVQIHPQDKDIQKLPKSSLQAMLSLQIQNSEDHQLSDTEDEDPKQTTIQPKRQMCEEGCC